MERDYGKELDKLKRELEEMREQLSSVVDLLTASASETFLRKLATMNAQVGGNGSGNATGTGSKSDGRGTP